MTRLHLGYPDPMNYITKSTFAKGRKEQGRNEERRRQKKKREREYRSRLKNVMTKKDEFSPSQSLSLRDQEEQRLSRVRLRV
jgi:hypothetical protein